MKIYAFGDSVVYGHTMPEKSFMRLLSDERGYELSMLAVNGATVVTADSASKEAAGEQTKGNYILSQVSAAPEAAPDVVVFNGGTNDSYGDPASDIHNPRGDHMDIMKSLGVIKGPGADSYDTLTFCGGFERILCEMRKKWGDTPIIYVTVHKSGGRDWEVQTRLRELALAACEKWGVAAADVFSETELDTRDADQMREYIMEGAGSHPNEAACRRFYMPTVLRAIEDAVLR